MCRDEQEAKWYSRLNAVISRLLPLAEVALVAELRRASKVPSLAPVLTTPGKFYVVRVGKDGLAGIYLEWYVNYSLCCCLSQTYAFTRADTYEHVNRIENADFMKKTTLLDALVHMVAKSTYNVKCVGTEIKEELLELYTSDSDSDDIEEFLRSIPRSPSPMKIVRVPPTPLTTAAGLARAFASKSQPPMPGSLPLSDDESRPPHPFSLNTDDVICIVDDDDDRNEGASSNTSISVASKSRTRQRSPTKPKQGAATVSASIPRQRSPTKMSTKLKQEPCYADPPPLVPPVVLASTPSSGFLRLRDAQGHVVKTIMHPTTEEGQVPRLGHLVDSFLDAFGYTSEFCHCLADARARAKTADAFALLMADYISYAEAEWFWIQIDRTFTAESPYRVRRFCN